MKKNIMIYKFAILGMDFTSEVRAILRLLFLEIIFKGLRILRIRSDFTAEMLTPGGIR